MQEPNQNRNQALVRLETERMTLFALSREQLLQSLVDPDRVGAELGIHITPEIFSEESRQAVGIKTTRMLLVDSALHAWYTYFLLVRRADHEAMGVCGFKGAPSPYGSVELGYAIQENYRNHGFMTEAVRALIAWAFEHEDCHRVVAETLRENLASQQVLKKAGLVFDRGLENMFYWKLDKPR